MRYGGTTGKLVIGLVLVVGLVAAACGGDDDELSAPAPAAPAAPAAAAEGVAAAADEPGQPEAAAVAVAAVEPATAEAPAGQVQRGTLRLTHTGASGGNEVLDPAAASSWAPVRKLIYDRLVILGENGGPTPNLATSWAIDDTLKKWTFGIQQGITFSEGNPLTSQDVKYTFQHLLDPDVGNQMASVLTMVDPSRFETPDDHTFVINLTQPHVDLPLLLRNETVRIIPDGITREFMIRQANGTGPYTVEHISIDGLSSFVSRDDHWDGLPGTERVTVVMISSGDARVQAFLAGQTDMVDTLSVAQVQLVEGDDNFYIQENSQGRTHLLVPLVTDEPYNDVRVLQAMKAVLDPDEMIAVAAQGHATKACNNPVRPNDQYFLPQECPQDIELARSLLADAGYPDGLSVELTISAYSGWWALIATIYQEQAAEAGLNVEIRNAPAQGYWSEVWQLVPFFMSTWGWRDGDAFLNEAFRCDASWSEGYWCNSEYEALLDGARAESNFDARKALYQQAQAILVDQGPTVIPFFVNNIRALNSRVHGFEEWWFAREDKLYEVTVDPL